MAEEILCPHCDKKITPSWAGDKSRGIGRRDAWVVQPLACPLCNMLIVKFKRGTRKKGLFFGIESVLEEEIIWPVGGYRRPIPEEVPADLKNIYQDACRVLSISPYASAVMSRRFLDHYLQHHLSIESSDLDQSIKEAVKQHKLPNHTSDLLPIIRKAGVLGAHSCVDRQTGEPLILERDEAKALLGLIELIFQDAFVSPARAEKLRLQADSIDKKHGRRKKPAKKGKH